MAKLLVYYLALSINFHFICFIPINISQYILGIIPTLDGLKIDPVLPKSINEFTLDRLYQGCLYHIEAKRGNQYSMMVDNKLINGNIVPSFNKKEVNVKITYID